MDLTADDYYGSGVAYLGFTLWDSPLCSILPYLGVAASYIHTALTQGGKVRQTS